MWKEAIYLTKFELSTSFKKRLTSQIFILAALLLFMMSSIQSYLEVSVYGIDLFFIIALGYASAWSAPKDFQYQKLGHQSYASPVFLMLYNLPIKKDTLIKSRFIVFLCNTIPFLILFFTIFYFTPGLKEIMTFGSYISFSIIWIGFAIMFGAIFPYSEVGDHQVGPAAIIKAIVIVIIVLNAITVPPYIFFGDGIIMYTIYLANKWPVLTAFIFIILTSLILFIWYKNALKKVKREEIML